VKKGSDLKGTEVTAEGGWKLQEKLSGYSIAQVRPVATPIEPPTDSLWRLPVLDESDTQ